MEGSSALKCIKQSLPIWCDLQTWRQHTRSSPLEHWQRQQDGPQDRSLQYSHSYRYTGRANVLEPTSCDPSSNHFFSHLVVNPLRSQPPVSAAITTFTANGCWAKAFATTGWESLSAASLLARLQAYQNAYGSLSSWIPARLHTCAVWPFPQQINNIPFFVLCNTWSYDSFMACYSVLLIRDVGISA